MDEIKDFFKEAEQKGTLTCSFNIIDGLLSKRLDALCIVKNSHIPSIAKDDQVECHVRIWAMETAKTKYEARNTKIQNCMQSTITDSRAIQVKTMTIDDFMLKVQVANKNKS